MLKIRKFVLPSTVLAISFYGSLLFALGAVLGYIGIDYYCKKYIYTGKINSITFNIKGWEIYLHHWITAGLMILSAYVLGFIYSIPIIIIGFLAGLVFHDIYTDIKLHENDTAWYNVIYKK